MGVITSKAEHAIFILMELASRPLGPALSTSEAVTRRDLPPKLAPQLVAALRRRGWIWTERGPCGGIGLAVDPTLIPVGAVIEAIEGETGLRACVLGAPCPRNHTCALRETLCHAQEVVDEVLWGTTIADLVEAERDIYRDLARRQTAATRDKPSGIGTGSGRVRTGRRRNPR